MTADRERVSWFSDLQVIMVLYRSDLQNTESFQSLLQADTGGHPLHLYVYDNSPEPQQPPHKPGINLSYRHDPSNPGVSTAYNHGVAHAKAHGRTWALLLDQDTQLPPDIFTHYQKAVSEAIDIRLFVPVLKLANGKIFSPCGYRFKRGFYRAEVLPGIHGFSKLVPVNSGMLVRIDAFLEVGGYKETVKLDFSDFQFIERFKRKYPRFFVLDVTCEQNFSDEGASMQSQLLRYRYFCEGARHSEKPSFWDRLQFGIMVFLRGLNLAVRHRSLRFLAIYGRHYLDLK